VQEKINLTNSHKSLSANGFVAGVRSGISAPKRMPEKNAPEKEEAPFSMKNYHCTGLCVPTDRRETYCRAGKLPGSIFQLGSEHLVKAPSIEPSYQDVVAANYESDFYNYNQSELNYFAPFGFPTTQTSLYSPPEEWYNQTNENLSKYNDNIVNMRVSNYIPNEYNLNQTGTYY